jgi:hypothetical protein
VTSSEMPPNSDVCRHVSQRMFMIGCGQSLAKRWLARDAWRFAVGDGGCSDTLNRRIHSSASGLQPRALRFSGSPLCHQSQAESGPRIFGWLVKARHGPSHVGTMMWASRAALGAGGRNGTDRVIHKRDEKPLRGEL